MGEARLWQRRYPLAGIQRSRAVLCLRSTHHPVPSPRPRSCPYPDTPSRPSRSSRASSRHRLHLVTVSFFPLSSFLLRFKCALVFYLYAAPKPTLFLSCLALYMAASAALTSASASRASVG